MQSYKIRIMVSEGTAYNSLHKLCLSVDCCAFPTSAPKYYEITTSDPVNLFKLGLNWSEAFGTDFNNIISAI